MEVGVWLLLGPVASAQSTSPPTVVLDLKRDLAVVIAAPPPGTEFSHDGPFVLRVAGPDAGWSVEGLGARLGEPLVVPRTPGDVEGRLEVGLCTLDGKTCAQTEWTLRATVPASGRAVVSLTVAAPPAEVPEVRFGPSADAGVLDAALARAKDSGKPVLADFSAAWCPPCNQLAAELLDAPNPDPALDGYELAVIDADHPSSFAAKDRYDVGGYPTILVLDPDGSERTRMVGYPGLEPMRAWLAGAAGATDARDLAAGPDAADGARAAALAWWLAGAGREDEAAPWLARAVAAHDDSADRHLAALASNGDPAELRWVLDHAPDRVLDALGPSAGLAEKEPALVRTLCDAADGRAEGTAQADVLELRAGTFAEGPERTALLRGAAAVLIARRTGDPALDKPFVTWLASLLERSGQAEDAVALLRSASDAWPSEPTWDLALAPLLVRLGRPAEALPAAERAAARAWGDNRLRAVAAQARVLLTLGRGDEARALAAAELAAQPAPPAGTNPRTDRYRETLRKLAVGEG